VLGANGDHVRWIHAQLARRLIDSRVATVVARNGSIRAIQLVPVSHFAERIGPPEGRGTGVRFAVREFLDTGHVTWRHHPRCTYPEPSDPPES
jgi:hypothetical protein